MSLTSSVHRILSQLILFSLSKYKANDNKFVEHSQLLRVKMPTSVSSLFLVLIWFNAYPAQGLLRGKLFETLPHRNYSQDDVGKPLFLTPFLQNDEVAMAKNYSRVRGLPGAETLESYSGYLTVNEEFNSNLFFWFFPSVSSSNIQGFIFYLRLW